MKPVYRFLVMVNKCIGQNVNLARKINRHAIVVSDAMPVQHLGVLRMYQPLFLYYGCAKSIDGRNKIIAAKIGDHGPSGL